MNKKNVYVQILQAARKRIATGTSEFICIAIRFDLCQSRFSYDDRNRLAHWIADSLKDSGHRGGSVEGWLKKVHGIRPYDFPKSVRQNYRLAWIDQMIEIVKDWE